MESEKEPQPCDRLKEEHFRQVMDQMQCLRCSVSVSLGRLTGCTRKEASVLGVLWERRGCERGRQRPARAGLKADEAVFLV